MEALAEAARKGAAAKDSILATRRNLHQRYRLKIRKANSALGAGRFEEAEVLLRAGLEVAGQFGEHDWRRLKCLEYLSIVYRKQGRYSDAINALRDALASGDRASSTNLERQADRYCALGGLYLDQGIYNKAASSYEKAVSVLGKLGVSKSDLLPVALNNLASIYGELGRHAEAIPILKRALAIAIKRGGPEHPEAATAMNNLASMYSNINRYDEARSLYERAVVITEKKFGPINPRTIRIREGIAILFQKEGKYGEAEKLYRRLLADYEKASTPAPSRIGDVLRGLAVICAILGKNKEAESHYQRSISVLEQSPRDQLPGLAAALSYYGGFLIDQKRYEKAEPMLVRAAAIQLKALGPHNSELAWTLEKHADLLRKTNRPAEAEKLEQRVRAIQQK